MALSSMARALTGKVALVTGGGTGIGQGICLQLAKAGATVIACGRTQKTLDQTVDKLSSLGFAGGAKTADVTDEARVRQVVDEVIKERGSVDILVNNAGIEGYVGPFEDMPVKAYDELVAANLKSQVLTCMAVIPHMKARALSIKEEAKSAGKDSFVAVAEARPHAGAIVNLSSIAGKRGFPGLAAYSATNWARIGLTQSLALELAEHYITVNAICPGIVWTPIWDNLASAMGGGDDAAEKQKVFQNKVETLIPMKKPQTPDEMGELVAFLASQPNITGQSVALDGGYLA